MIGAIAQMPDAIFAAVIQSGFGGVFCLWLMWRDGKQQERQDEQQKQQALKFDKLTESVDRLAKALLIEAMSRPQAPQRVTQEAHQLLDTFRP